MSELLRDVRLLPITGGTGISGVVRIDRSTVRIAGYAWHALPTGESDADGYELWQMYPDAHDLAASLGIGTEPMTDEDWEDTES